MIGSLILDTLIKIWFWSLVSNIALKKCYFYSLVENGLRNLSSLLIHYLFLWQFFFEVSYFQVSHWLVQDKCSQNRCFEALVRENKRFRRSVIVKITDFHKDNVLERHIWRAFSRRYQSWHTMTRLDDASPPTSGL